MAPLIHDVDFSLASHENTIEQPKTIFAPLHENSIATSRRVSFGVMVATYEVMNLEDYTSDEKKATWFDSNDMRRMKESVRSEAKLAESGLLVQGDDVSLRGLESRTRDGLKRKRRNRMNAYAAVFFEIDCQDQEGFIDEELIADAYFTHTEHCSMTAQMIGKRDEKEAMEIFQTQKKDFFGKNFHDTLVRLSTTEGFLASSAA
mmetsp:Transcript_5354/g.15547  ORF Transcript_5354/g.15547 Transcript_5354/m.15547 type:complete len:204 (+) Transcript_5354:266-877(+)